MAETPRCKSNTFTPQFAPFAVDNMQGYAIICDMDYF